MTALLSWRSDPITSAGLREIYVITDRKVPTVTEMPAAPR